MIKLVELKLNSLKELLLFRKVEKISIKLIMMVAIDGLFREINLIAEDKVILLAQILSLFIEIRLLFNKINNYHTEII